VLKTVGLCWKTILLDVILAICWAQHADEGVRVVEGRYRSTKLLDNEACVASYTAGRRVVGICKCGGGVAANDKVGIAPLPPP
jgi:hypothetical protein